MLKYQSIETQMLARTKIADPTDVIQRDAFIQLQIAHNAVPGNILTRVSDPIVLGE